MVETLSHPASTASAISAERETPAPVAPKSNNPVERGVFNAAKQIGHNIDLVTFQGRVKDLYKLGDTFSVGFSLFLQRVFSAWKKRPTPNETRYTEQTQAAAHEFDRAMQAGDQAGMNKASLRNMHLVQAHEAETKQYLANKNSAEYGGRIATDGVNFLAQLGIARISNEVEQEKLMKVYEKSISQELGQSSITRADLKKSRNPIISNSVDYYATKGKYRMAPVWAGLVQLVPITVSLLGKALKPVFGDKAKTIEHSMDWMKGFSGVDASLGSMAAYYVWYFSKRQKGAFYQLDDIWDQTEGILSAENRSINRGVNPGTLVTSEKITKLYDEVAKEQNLASFEVTDPLTNRIFDQIARYLNHQYMPLLYQVKKPDPELHQELNGSHFTHADLVTLFGTKGIDINDAYATALRMETLARKGIDEYREVNARIAEVARPETQRFADEAGFAAAMQDYLGTLDRIAGDVLGDAWPAAYIKKEIRPNAARSYDGDMPAFAVTAPDIRVSNETRTEGPINTEGPAGRVPSYAEAAPQTAAALRHKLDGSLQQRNFRDRIPAPLDRAAETQPATHGERAEASQGASMVMGV